MTVNYNRTQGFTPSGQVLIPRELPYLIDMIYKIKPKTSIIDLAVLKLRSISREKHKGRSSLCLYCVKLRVSFQSKAIHKSNCY